MDYSCIPPCDVPKMSPFSRTLNLQYLEVDESSSSVKLVASPTTSQPSNEYLDIRCIVGLVDHAMGYTLQGNNNELQPAATINLRIDLFPSPPINNDLTINCQIQNRHSSAALLTADIKDASGAIVARGVGFFTQRNYPGKVGLTDSPLTDYFPSNKMRSYADAIGLKHHGSGWLLESGFLGSVGWEPGNTFHGGAVGSLLMTCVEGALLQERNSKRIASFNITYLRSSSADQALHATCTPIRLGNYASFYMAECYQDDQEKVIAKAEFCCLAT